MKISYKKKIIVRRGVSSVEKYVINCYRTYVLQNTYIHFKLSKLTLAIEVEIVQVSTPFQPYFYHKIYKFSF